MKRYLKIAISHSQAVNFTKYLHGTYFGAQTSRFNLRMFKSIFSVRFFLLLQTFGMVCCVKWFCSFLEKNLLTVFDVPIEIGPRMRGNHCHYCTMQYYCLSKSNVRSFSTYLNYLTCFKLNGFMTMSPLYLLFVNKQLKK